ncbi:MAG: efflux RND transporter permease subunit [Treponema sp.]|jgi:HAE1 family hydrophobic/amphiphilic exporter-1|nr:efflux RND transporter permease subunit [Treponema sp.]
MVIDRKYAYNLGVTIGDAAREIAAAMNGIITTIFRQSGSEYSVMLKLREEDRKKLLGLEHIFVASNTGKLVFLSNVAQLEKGMGPISIRHENQSRINHITGNIIEGKQINEVEQKIREVLGNNFIIPEGMIVTYEGQWQEITETASNVRRNNV